MHSSSMVQVISESVEKCCFWWGLLMLDYRQLSSITSLLMPTQNRSLVQERLEDKLSDQRQHIADMQPQRMLWNFRSTLAQVARASAQLCVHWMKWCRKPKIIHSQVVFSLLSKAEHVHRMQLSVETPTASRSSRRLCSIPRCVFTLAYRAVPAKQGRDCKDHFII